MVFHVSPLHSTQDYHVMTRRTRLVMLACLLIVVVLGILSLANGSTKLGFFQSAQALFGFGDPSNVVAVQSLRLPRVCTALIGGIGLALVGAVLQSVLENPLASSSTIGISQGAAFGATLAILVLTPLLGKSAATANVGMGVIALCAFCGAMFSSVVVLLFSRVARSTPESIILVGVALSSLFAGSSTILQYFAQDVELSRVIFWQFGDLGRATKAQIVLMAVVALLGAVYFVANRWNYNALQNGARTANGLGVNVTRTRLLTVLCASCVAAVITSFVGLINFVGLIAPHIARRLVGNDYRHLLPASALMGACIMLASDLVCRMIISPIILPIGAITSFLGAPLFLWLLFKGMK